MINEFSTYLNEELFKACDSVIRKIIVDATENSANIEFSVEGPDGWINIEIQMEYILEYQIKYRAPHDLDVMSGGIEYEIFDGKHFLDFCVYSGSGEGITKYRSSLLYFACKNFVYCIKEYSE